MEHEPRLIVNAGMLTPKGAPWVSLTGEFWLRRAKVMDRRRLEVGGGATERSLLTAMGCFVEIVAYTPRVFVPTDRPEVLAAVLARWPAQPILPKAA